MSERVSFSYRPSDDSVPWWLRVVWVRHVYSVLLVGCVVSRVLCVVCWLFLAMIRAYFVRGHVCVAPCFFATTIVENTS